ncbi:MAG TPA: hypothetical protein VEA60_13945 [Allosphingosinicella sp.]|nr:hypothetical protein [Allosphingosinicella sp.]
MKVPAFFSSWAASRLVGLLALTAITSACANENSIFRHNTIWGKRPQVITEDAKQRNTYVVPELVWDDAKKRRFVQNWRICAEASPDVFTALSTSAGADLGFNQSGTDTEAAAKLAIAIAESAGTIERTQTINLLRESMYRTCERYLSNALGKEAFVVQAGRDWRAMIAILAIEQLTRTARPAPTILIPGGTSATITTPSELATELRRASHATTNARIRDEAAKKALEGCPAAKPADNASDELKQKWESCAPQRQEAIDAAAELRRAEDAQKALADAVAKGGAAGGGTLGAKTEAGEHPQPGSPEQVRSATDLQAVAFTVERIVMEAFNTDEAQLFCLQTLSSTLAGEQGPRQQSSSAMSESAFEALQVERIRLEGTKLKLQEMCMKYALESLQRESGRRSLTAALESGMQPLVDYLGSDESLIAARWESLLLASGVMSSDLVLQRIKDSLKQARTRAEILAAFRGAGTSAQEIISRSIQNYGW